MRDPLQLQLEGRTCPVRVEPGILEVLGTEVGAVLHPSAVMLVVDRNILAPHGERAVASLRHAGLVVHEHAMVADEAHKTPATVEVIHEAMLEASLDRDAVVVALGGGITGDVAGFAAATLLRGVAVVQVPTTLLAMVDAAIGGKTGVNLPLPGEGGLGKNLSGAFWQPSAVIVDPAVLATLPARHLRCGLAECVKHGEIGAPALLERIESQAEAILAADPGAMTDLIEQAARVKIAVVEADEKEASGRRVLNLGHTFAHAAEAFPNLDLLHGEAVAIGLCAAFRCARATGRITAPRLDRLEAILEQVGLPRRLPHPVPPADLARVMGYDKKVRHGRILLVLPTGELGVELDCVVDPDTLADAWRAVGAET